MQAEISGGEMGLQLKRVADQVIVITGASSGIGLCTARMAAERGASVVLAARNERVLRDTEREIRERGGRAVHVVADVSERAETQRIADTAIQEFGRIDTWVNNAALTMYGRALEIEREDARRLFDVNLWGLVNGCEVAVPHLAMNGGALINIGSVLSERAIPLQSMYVSSKHAVKGYTDTLRMELEEADLPISVTLVKPTSIDTPFFQHARNYMDAEPAPPPPVYDPEVVANTILECAERPTRDIFVGGAAKVFDALEHHAPRLTDRVMSRTMFEQQKADHPPQYEDNFHTPSPWGGHERGMYPGHVMQSSVYTSSRLHPARTALLAIGLGLTVYAGTRYFGSTGDE